MYKFYDFYFYAELAYSGPDPYYFNWKLFKKKYKKIMCQYFQCVYCVHCTVYTQVGSGSELANSRIRIRIILIWIHITGFFELISVVNYKILIQVQGRVGTLVQYNKEEKQIFRFCLKHPFKVPYCPFKWGFST